MCIEKTGCFKWKKEKQTNKILSKTQLKKANKNFVHTTVTKLSNVWWFNDTTQAAQT